MMNGYMALALIFGCIAICNIVISLIAENYVLAMFNAALVGFWIWYGLSFGLDK